MLTLKRKRTVSLRERIIGGAIGIIGVVVPYYLFGFNLMAVLVASSFVIGFIIVVSGFRTDRIQMKSAPNQGIHLSARNATIVGIISGSAGMVYGALMVRVGIFEMMPYMPPGVEFLTSMWFFGLLMGVFFGLMAASGIGGAAGVFKHYALRFLLWLTGYLPWKLAPFLDYAADRIFLRKVGGGYIFIHHYLMEYFASLTEEDIERLSAEIEAEKA